MAEYTHTVKTTYRIQQIISGVAKFTESYRCILYVVLTVCVYSAILPTLHFFYRLKVS